MDQDNTVVNEKKVLNILFSYYLPRKKNKKEMGGEARERKDVLVWLNVQKKYPSFDPI